MGQPHPPVPRHGGQRVCLQGKEMRECIIKFCSVCVCVCFLAHVFTCMSMCAPESVSVHGSTCTFRFG